MYLRRTIVCDFYLGYLYNIFALHSKDEFRVNDDRDAIRISNPKLSIPRETV